MQRTSSLLLPAILLSACAHDGGFTRIEISDKLTIEYQGTMTRERDGVISFPAGGPLRISICDMTGWHFIQIAGTACRVDDAHGRYNTIIEATGSPCQFRWTKDARFDTEACLMQFDSPSLRITFRNGSTFDLHRE